MGKRFTDTEKWFDPWFGSLKERDRAVWLFILDRCDHSGIWKVSEFMVNTFFPGYKLQPKIFGDRVQVISPEKWLVRKFLNFQYGNPKNSNKALESAIQGLENNGITEVLFRGYLTPTKDLPRSYLGGKAKAKAKAKAEAKTGRTQNDRGNGILHGIEEQERLNKLIDKAIL